MLRYDWGKGKSENWIVGETEFQSNFQGKFEANCCLGNGYMGLRSATEESYVGQTRNFFIAGTFNKFSQDEVTELPNAADQAGMDIRIDGVRFSLEKGTVSDYRRTLDLKSGELVRAFHWTHPNGKSFSFEFRRFVSRSNLHLLASQLKLIPLDSGAIISIHSGINGRMTNSGSQHFEEGEKRVFDNRYLQMVQKTTESGISFVHNSVHQIEASAGEHIEERFVMGRRVIDMIFRVEPGRGTVLTIQKISNVFTTRDLDAEASDLTDLRKLSLEALKTASRSEYDQLFLQSQIAWAEYWDQNDVKILSSNSFDQLAIRFALYHLNIMTPAHDSRFGIGAKALSGEGYKGHSFWDTEIFILPFFTFTNPGTAMTLLQYRYHTLSGARAKARQNGYKGAMYPWESAWMDDGEVTPVWGTEDIVTGEATKIWSGFLEQHITSDIVYAIWQYFLATGDSEFMEKFGFEIVIEAGIFWSSRLEWNARDEEYHITDVIGPDEYKEHVDNDAFTNYMAKWCMDLAIEYADQLASQNKSLYQSLRDKLDWGGNLSELREKTSRIYLPQPNEEGIIPQDDTYLSKKNIDLSKYRNQEHVGSIFLDLNLDQINEIQVTKQASVVMLMLLLEHQFDSRIKKANYAYYEPRTLHDSSLSLSTHSILAADVGDEALSYSLFEKACRIDLGFNMKSSDAGIHAASLGGIWQIIVFGFAGIRMVGGNLRIAPNLPDTVDEVQFPLIWQQNRLQFTVTHNRITIQISAKGLKSTINCRGKTCDLADDLSIGY